MRYDAILNVAIVVEDIIVLFNMTDVAYSFAVLMGIIYTLNLEYQSNAESYNEDTTRLP